MFTFTRLDTRVPPLWESYWNRENPNADDPHVDDLTSLQCTTGDDPVNKYTRQRIEGDLFRRDLILEKNLRLIYEWLRRRNGICINTPEVRLPPGASLTLLSFSNETAVDGWLAVALNAQITSGTASDLSLSIYDVEAEDDILSTTGTGVLWAAATLDDPVVEMDKTKSYICRMTNNGSSPIIVSGYAIVHPN